MQAPAAALTGGACGFGNLSAAQWPYSMVAAVSSSSPLLQGTAAHNACGSCVEVVCNDAVRFPSPGHVIAQLCCCEKVQCCSHTAYLVTVRPLTLSELLDCISDSKHSPPCIFVTTQPARLSP